jgi:hypothetical protein
MPNSISAEEVADVIVKSEERVRVAVALGNIPQDYIKESVQRLSEAIKQFHPNGPQGK